MRSVRPRIQFNGSAVRLARIRAGLTQEALARELNVTMRSVQFWEIDNVQPSAANLRRLCDVLGLAASELIDEAA